MPQIQVRQRDIATGAVSTQKRVFDEITGKVREARVFFMFRDADVPESMPHALGRTPNGFRVHSISAPLGTAPGQVYAPISGGGGAGSETDSAFNYTPNFLTLACTTADTWAEVMVS